jgi:hypothetical protein
MFSAVPEPATATREARATLPVVFLDKLACFSAMRRG